MVEDNIVVEYECSHSSDSNLGLDVGVKMFSIIDLFIKLGEFF